MIVSIIIVSILVPKNKNNVYNNNFNNSKSYY